MVGFFSVDIPECVFKVSVSHSTVKKKELLSTQLEMLRKSNQLFNNKLRCLSLGVVPFGSSINLVTSLAALCSYLSRLLQGLVPVGGVGGFSLASTPNV